LRLLPPFIIRSRDVAEFLKKFEAVLKSAAQSATAASSQGAKAAADAQPIARAAAR
jgi:hypothetical protein